MDNEIDSLSFKINIAGLGNKTLDKINNFIIVLKTLNETVKQLDLSQLDKLSSVKFALGSGKSLSSMASGLEKINTALNKSDFDKLAKLNQPIQFFQITNQTVKQTEQEAEALKQVADAQEKISKTGLAEKNGTFLDAGGTIEKLKTETPIEITKSFEAMIKENKELNKLLEKTGKLFKVINDPKKIKVSKELQAQVKANKEIANLVKKQGAVLESDEDEKGGTRGANRLVKTLKRIKLIAFIKLIRGALNAIIKGFQQGIQQLAMYSKEFNGTMSQMVTAFDKVKASIALIAQPFIEALLPVVQAFSQTMIEISNAISKANASAKGLTTYTRVSADYAKDYAQSMQKGALFSFDTFNTLNAEQSPYETASVDEEDNDQASALLETINLIKEAGEMIGKLVKTITPMVNKIFSALEPILDIIINISNEATDEIIPVITDFLEMITEIIGNLAPLIRDIFKELKPIISVINTDLLPNVMKLLKAVLIPISEIIGKLPIAEIVGLIVNTLSPVISIIGNIIGTIADILTPIFDFISDFLSPFLDIFKAVISSAGEHFKAITDIFGNFFKTWKPIFDLFIALFKGDSGQLSQTLGNVGKELLRGLGNAMLSIVKIGIKLVEKIVNGLISAINAVIANDFIKWIANDVFGGDWQGITWRANWSDKITLDSFASGGIVGEVWQMNEYGNPEMLYSANNSGNTAVINQAQLAQAFEEAIYRTGIIQAIEDDKYVVIDGKAIAQSRSFKNELNRTNPKLALK